MIEVTQSKVASTHRGEPSSRTSPMITRSVSGMLALLPGAAPMAPTRPQQDRTSAASRIGGASGTNVMPTVDGADNRDNRYGGPLITFTTEALEQFQLATSQFTAADGRTGGAALTMVTKSGTNAVARLGVPLCARQVADARRTTSPSGAGQPKVPFNRQQFGGSMGGPMLRNRMFFFGAVEQSAGQTRPSRCRTTSMTSCSCSLPARPRQSRTTRIAGPTPRASEALYRQGKRAAHEHAVDDGALRRAARIIATR